MKLTEFIKTALIEDIDRIQQAGGHFHSFSLMAQGIELLGACLDEKPFHESGHSRKRFRRAVGALFPSAYQPFNQVGEYDLYNNLRCGLLHVVLPKSRLELIQRMELEQFPCGHLGFDDRRGNRRLVLVAEDMYVDFATACREVIRRIEAGELRQEKLRRMRLAV